MSARKTKCVCPDNCPCRREDDLYSWAAAQLSYKEMLSLAQFALESDHMTGVPEGLLNTAWNNIHDVLRLRKAENEQNEKPKPR